MTQCERVLRHLKTYKKITPMEAMRDYGIMRLASRINELRKMGVSISSRTEKGKNRFGEDTHYSVYYYEGAGTWNI